MTFSVIQLSKSFIPKAQVALTLAVLALASLLLQSTANAEEKTLLGNWEVHHIVLSTTFLTPEIAKANNIVRSKYNALVNISVLDSKDKTAQNVSITGTARNLLGNSKKLSFKKVTEGDAIYYLAVFSYAHKEKFRFDINIQQGNETQTLQLEQEMYVD
jgi:hypothetical protein